MIDLIVEEDKESVDFVVKLQNCIRLGSQIILLKNNSSPEIAVINNNIFVLQ